LELRNKLLCRWDLLRLVREDQIRKADGTFFTLSVIDENQMELMIFLDACEDELDYEVRIYKSEPDEKYVPDKDDKVERYEENEEYASFIFLDFLSASEFIQTLSCFHPEFQKRPAREI